MPEITETFFARDRGTWRTWLRRHHVSKKEIWLLMYKKHTGEACISYDAAVEEALCFGWIDGILKRIDDQKHVIRFSPRRPNSIWSESNKARVRRMIEQKRMTAAGMALVKAAKKSGQWRRASARETVTALPEDLSRALTRNKRAKESFDSFAPSHRRTYIHWVLDAKRAETRRRRVREVVRRSAAGKKPGIDM